MIGKLLLNRYELLEKIGEGGMGIVYKAKCHLLNRFVAVKILKSELSNDEGFVARFKREANSAASLSHANIVNVHDVGSENNINFIVMEYINGKTLKQVIKENGRLSSLKTLEISLQIAKALECAHKNNIIHRDIKPDNILITEDSIVKVADFGIAKVVDSATISNSNMVIGSVHYFSPEQAKGMSVDYRTDIYSLGIVMYEMVTGQVPYNAEISVSIAIMHIQESVIPPKEVITDIPEDINQVILKTLEKEPINRYQTAREIADILNTINEDFNSKVKLHNKSLAATMVMMTEPVVVSDTKNDSTAIMTQVADSEKPLIKKDIKVLLENKSTSNNKKIMIIVGSIILVMIIGIFGKYIFKGPSTDIETPLAETAVPEVSVQLPEDENKLVPSLIGMTQDIATNTIVSNGFSLGNISNDYSNSIPKGSIISQSPMVNTSYEKNGKINLVISQGQKVVQDAPQIKGNKQKENKGKNNR
jgi:serine/threonine protein kinase